MSATSRLHPLALGLAVGLAATAGCASGKAERREAPAPSAEAAATPASGKGAKNGGGAAAEAKGPAAGAPGAVPSGRQLSPKAQRLFEDAVAAATPPKDAKGAPVDWDNVERRWRAVLDVEPVPEAYHNLGVALEKRGKLDEARAAYRRALELQPELAPSAVNLALLEEPKDPLDAARLWTDLSRRFPDDAVPRARLASLYAASGQYEEASRLAREALVKDPRAAGAHKVLMRIAMARGDLELAALLAVKARALDENDPDLAQALGDIALAQKDPAAAAVQWKKALALDPAYLPARYALLQDATTRHAWAGVLEHGQVILKAQPDDARVQLAVGVAQRHLGKVDEAFAAFDSAQKASGDRLAEVHLARGIAYMKSKDQCEPAIGEFQRYLEIAGPAAAADGPAGKLMRECTQIVAANKAAADAAKELKAQAEKQKKGSAQGGTPASPGADPAANAPASPGSPAKQTGDGGTGAPDPTR